MSQIVNSNPQAPVAQTNRIYPDPRSMFYNLFTNTKTAIKITSDEGIALSSVTTTPNTDVLNTTSPLIIVAMDPYPPEAQGFLPQVIIGDANDKSVEHFYGVLNGYNSLITRTVEIRVLSRDIDQNMLGFISTGNNTRLKIVRNIRDIVRQNASDPDGTHVFGPLVYTNTSQSDVPTGASYKTKLQAVPLYVSTLKFDVTWME